MPNFLSISIIVYISVFHNQQAPSETTLTEILYIGKFWNYSCLVFEKKGMFYKKKTFRKKIQFTHSSNLKK